MTTQIGPRTAAANQLHAMKYRGLNEDFEEATNRWAFGLGDNSRHYHALRGIFLPQRFCPGGRIQGAIGATRRTTAFNCYVSGRIPDSLDGILDRLKDSALTAKLGGGIGYDFSTLRPRGDSVKSIETDATGPVSFMDYFNSVGLGVASSGHRRGAQMAILRVDHPDIEEFIRCKQWTATQWALYNDAPEERKAAAFQALQAMNPLQGFNVSVGVTDEFMEAVYADGLFALRFGGTDYRQVRAVDLWNKIMRGTWDWAEPGVFYLDAVNRMNNLHYCETIHACNPCGEQPLPPYGACLLGSHNLPAYLKPNVPVSREDAIYIATNEGRPAWWFDYDQYRADIPHVVRGMDNVIDRTIYPLAEQEREAKDKRRMGIGVMGLANAGEALGFSYGSKGFLEFEARVLSILRDEAYRASALLAAEKGAFPLYDAERYLEGEFIKTLPDDVRALIKKHGIRNSHLTSIAPTGTISMCADNVSSGIEPVIYHAVKRPVNTPQGRVETVIEDFGAAFLGVRGKLSADVTPQEHVDVLLTAQRYVDSAVSKTCNTTGATPWDDFLGIYAQVHRGGGKGCTTFNKDGKRAALLTAGSPPTADDGPTCEVDANGTRSCA
jgi:ribonucleoside-diphosphate reductase alpha chain